MGEQEDKIEKSNEANAGEKEKGTEAEEYTLLKKEYEELKERQVRLMAEFDNYKKKADKEISNSKEMGIIELVKPMLNVLDEFDLMLVALNRSEDKEMAKGMELLYANFVETLKKFGLREVEAKGNADPYKHEIAMCAPSNEKEGMILKTIKKGYMMNEKLIRPATVIISSGVKDDK